MKKLSVILILAWLALAGGSAFAQNQCADLGTPQCRDSRVVSTSGNSVKILSNGGLAATFEEVIAGAPSTVSIVIKGCGDAGTCTTLDTYTTVANATRSPSITTPYAYYTVTASWTGGTSVTVTVNTRETTAALEGSGSTVSPATYFESGTYVTESVGMFGNNDETCGTLNIPSQGLSVGHIGFNVAAGDGGGGVLSDVGILSSTGAVVAHIGAQSLSATGDQLVAISGGTKSIPGGSGKAYVCWTSTGSSLSIGASPYSSAIHAPFQASVTTSGGVLGAMTPPADSPVVSSLTTPVQVAIVLYP